MTSRLFPPLLALSVVLPALAGVVALSLPAAAADTTVELLDNQFDPADVTVTVGDTVTWLWVGENRHSVRSNDGGFGSHQDCGPLRQENCGTTGTTFQHTFDAPGTFTVRCEVHGLAGMVSTVTVQAAPSPTPSPPTTASPTATPTPTPTSSSPSPSPTPDPPPTNVGPPPPRPNDPLPVIPGEVVTAPSSPTPDPELTFEPFPEQPSIPTPDPDADEVVVAAPSGPSGLARGVTGSLALAALLAWAGLFGRWVLLADPWDAPAA